MKNGDQGSRISALLKKTEQAAACKCCWSIKPLAAREGTSPGQFKLSHPLSPSETGRGSARAPHRAPAPIALSGAAHGGELSGKDGLFSPARAAWDAKRSPSFCLGSVAAKLLQPTHAPAAQAEEHAEMEGLIPFAFFSPFQASRRCSLN